MQTNSAMTNPIGLSLNPRSDTPLYQQLFDAVVERIQAGTFPPGFRLPPTRSLADELGAHRNTVVRAYEELETSGFVTSTVGRGTFVAEATDRPLQKTGGGDAWGALPWGSLLSAASDSEPLSRLDRLRRDRAPEGAVNLTGMQPPSDLLPTDLLRRCIDHVLKTLGPDALGYADRAGIPRLKRAIAADLERRALPAQADHLVVTTGSQQALDLIVRALVDPGDTVLVSDSTYSGIVTVLAMHGARLVSVPFDDDGPNLDSLDRLGRADAKLLYCMPDHNNPTGTQISAERRRALVEWSHRTGTALLEDDYASDLELEPVQRPAALRTLDAEVIHVGTFSKRLIPALRIGYVVAPEAIYGRLVAIKQAMDLGCSGLMQHALAEFLERGYFEPHLARVRPEYIRRRDALERGLSRYLPETFTWKHPKSGLTLWLELPPDVSPLEVFDEGLREGVLVSPGTLNAPDRTPAPGIRLSYCSEPPKRLSEGARRLGRVLQTLCARRPRGNGDQPAPIAGI